MRRKRLPGTRKPLRRPLSKQRMMVCCDTLQISAASPVVNTVFMAQTLIPCTLVALRRTYHLPKLTGQTAFRPHSLKPVRRENHTRVSGLIHLPHLTIGSAIWQLEQDGGAKTKEPRQREALHQ